MRERGERAGAGRVRDGRQGTRDFDDTAVAHLKEESLTRQRFRVLGTADIVFECGLGEGGNRTDCADTSVIGEDELYFGPKSSGKRVLPGDLHADGQVLPRVCAGAADLGAACQARDGCARRVGWLWHGLVGEEGRGDQDREEGYRDGSDLRHGVVFRDCRRV